MSAVSYFSVCSGIEAISVAVEPFGWHPVGFAEIDAAASRVLAHRYGSNMPGEPLAANGVPNHGDFTQIDLTKVGRVDVLVGGTPCQAFSIAGKRLSLADARGNLTLAFVVLAHELARSHGLRNAWWENVPGVLNTPDNAFGCFLGAIVGSDDALRTPDGEGWPDVGMVAGPRARAAWRVLDAQYFGLAQRRKRVFVVVDFGNGADPVEVLFERQGLRGNSAPRRETREGIAPTLSARTKGGGGLGTDFDCDGGLVPQAFGGGNTSGPIDAAACLTAKGQRIDFEVETFIAHSLRGEGFDASEDGTGRGTPLIPVAYRTSGNCGAWETGDTTDALTTSTDPNSHVLAQAFDLRGREGGAQFEGPHDTANIRAASGGSSRSYVAAAVDPHPTLCSEPGGPASQDWILRAAVNHGGAQWAVRRLTPRECERLQGFPDDWTLTPDARGNLQADGPRYKQLGNSMAVNVVRWIGGRLDRAILASMEDA